MLHQTRVTAERRQGLYCLRGLRRRESIADRVSDQFGRGGIAEPVLDIQPMSLHGLAAYPESPRNLLVGLAFRHKLDDHPLGDG